MRTHLAILTAAALSLSGSSNAQSYNLLHVLEGQEPSFGHAVSANEHLIAATSPPTLMSDGTFTPGVTRAYDAQTYELKHTIDNPNRGPYYKGFRFGYQVAVSDDHVATNHSYRFSTSPDSPKYPSILIDNASTGEPVLRLVDPGFGTNQTENFGDSIALNGDYIAARTRIYSHDTGRGGSYRSHVQLFDYAGTLLHTLSSTNDARALSDFGISLAFTDDILLVGEPDYPYSSRGLNSWIGRAQLFDPATGELIYTYENPNQIPYSRFGSSIAINESYTVIATQNFEGDSVHIYDTSSRELLYSLSLSAQINHTNLNDPIAISEDYLLVSISNEYRRTEVRLFNIHTGELLHTFHNPDATAENSFGISVALGKQTAIIGSPIWYNRSSSTPGNVYIYSLCPCDRDGSGTVDFLDLLDFLDTTLGKSANPGKPTFIYDLLNFLDCFMTGCE